MRDLIFIRAVLADLPEIVRLLADDPLGQQREQFRHPLPESYINAFHAIDTDPNNELVVVKLDGAVVGTLQLTYIPSISFQGGRRCTVESVRVDERFRGQGIGRELMIWAIDRARQNGCVSMQLTTHNQRPAAHRFYESLGFSKTHIGMKLGLK